MTKMLQKSENVAKNVVNENSQDLTEQWKKGELINGKKYYITFFDSEPFEATFVTYTEAMFPYWKFEANGKQYCDENGYDCVKVLAPVPTFDEWEQLQNWADFTNDYHELREKLEIAEYENAQLKELLKKCREPLEVLAEKRDACDWCPEYLLAKIDEVLR